MIWFSCDINIDFIVLDPASQLAVQYSVKVLSFSDFFYYNIYIDMKPIVSLSNRSLNIGNSYDLGFISNIRAENTATI